MRGDAAFLIVFVPGNDRAPRGFGDQHQPVQMGNDADFMALNLIAAPAFVLETGGGEALFQLRLGVVGTGASYSLLKFPFVILKVVINALQFPPQITGLAGADAGEVAGQIFV